MNPQSITRHNQFKDSAVSRIKALAEIDVRLDAVRTCVRWLTYQGIHIAGVDLRVGGAGKPVVDVEASPRLHLVFRDECGHGQHWDRATGRTLIDFRAVWAGCEVRWSEVAQ